MIPVDTSSHRSLPLIFIFFFFLPPLPLRLTGKEREFDAGPGRKERVTRKKSMDDESWAERQGKKDQVGANKEAVSFISSSARRM